MLRNWILFRVPYSSHNSGNGPPQGPRRKRPEQRPPKRRNQKRPPEPTRREPLRKSGGGGGSSFLKLPNPFLSLMSPLKSMFGIMRPNSDRRPNPGHHQRNRPSREREQNGPAMPVGNRRHMLGPNDGKRKKGPPRTKGFPDLPPPSNFPTSPNFPPSFSTTVATIFTPPSSRPRISTAVPKLLAANEGRFGPTQKNRKTENNVPKHPRNKPALGPSLPPTVLGDSSTHPSGPTHQANPRPRVTSTQAPKRNRRRRRRKNNSNRRPLHKLNTSSLTNRKLDTTTVKSHDVNVNPGDSKVGSSSSSKFTLSNISPTLVSSVEGMTFVPSIPAENAGRITGISLFLL